MVRGKSFSVVSVNCPTCGSPVSFRTEFSTHAVCSACDSLLVRQGAQVDMIGKVAELQPDGSPLALGTQGSHEGSAFELVGRIQLSFGDGFWNEWYLLYADGKTGWLGEAMGEYFINTLAKTSGGLPAPANLAPGDAISLGGEAFVATGKVASKLVSFEGELPFIVEDTQPFQTVDLRSASGRAATIDYSENPPLLFLGEYKPFSAFSFISLRPDGPSGTDPKTTAVAKAGVENFNCPTCGAPHTVAGGARSKTLVCQYCGSAVDISNPKLKVMWREESMRDEVSKGITLPIGSRARFDGLDFVLIGFLKKSVRYEGVTYPWVEYLLYNRFDGYRWLVESDGHFTLISTLNKLPTRGGTAVTRPDESSIDYDGDNFKHFQTSNPVVDAVAGEFYWRVKKGEEATNFDYVAPPRMLSLEVSGTGFVWSVGTYLTQDEVRSAFNLQKQIRFAVGVAPNQPNPYKESAQFLWRLFGAASLLGLVLMLTGILPGSGKIVWTSGFVKYDTFRTFAPQESQPFQVSGHGNLAFDFDATLNNRWLYFDTQLVDVQTQKAYKVGATIENYGGSGPAKGRVRMAGIPSGQYKLLWTIKSGTTDANAEVADTKKPTEQVSYFINLRRGTAVWGWYFLMLIALLPIPLFEMARRSGFETKRWYNSDHA